jgi:beta-lactam-binding protein with PASTA domain
VVVPDVVGLDDTVATERLEKSGLKVRMRREPARARPGSVFRQTPEPSTRVAPGSLVDITVAQQIFVEPPKPPDFGAQPDATVNWVVVPDLLGVDSQRAGSMLDRVGLRGRQRRVATARANPGVIIGQNPPAGTKVIRGSLVDLSVAVPGQPDAQPQPTAPQQPTQYKMPNLVGRPFGQALEDATVTQIGLRIIRQDDRFANARPGIVVRQSVAAADPVTPASVVTVWVATGAVVPDVAGLPSQLARQRVVDAGLQPRLNEVVRDGAPGIVVDQTPNPGVVVSRGAAVGLSISVLERVTVPDVRRRPRGDTANMLADLRLKGEFGTDPESDLAPDLVANQDPQPGVDVDVGTVVRMRVATGVVVPAVVKLSANVARARLEAATLGVEERTEVNDGVPESTVLRQSPESSARVARGAIVSVVVAVRRTVAVPDLLGRARADVERLLSPLALTPQFETATTAAPDARPGTVVQQVPVAGTIVGTGAMIRVVLVPAAGLPLPAGAQLPAAAQPRLTAGQPPPSEPAGSVPPPLGWWQHYPSSALPWLLGVGLFTLVAYRFIKANRGGVEIRTPDVPPLLDLQLEPHPGEAVARLAVSGPSLIKFDVRIRTATDPGEQTLLPAGPLLGEERRLYE